MLLRSKFQTSISITVASKQIDTSLLSFKLENKYLEGKKKDNEEGHDIYANKARYHEFRAFR